MNVSKTLAGSVLMLLVVSGCNNSEPVADLTATYLADLRHGTPDMRRDAARGLRNMMPDVSEDAKRALITALEDPDSGVRRAAAEALGRYRPKDTKLYFILHKAWEKEKFARVKTTLLHAKNQHDPSIKEIRDGPDSSPGESSNPE